MSWKLFFFQVKVIEVSVYLVSLSSSIGKSRDVEGTRSILKKTNII